MNKLRLQILSTNLLDEFNSNFDVDIDGLLNSIHSKETPVDSFQFYNSVSSVYSSKIEGEDIDLDYSKSYDFLMMTLGKIKV